MIGCGESKPSSLNSFGQSTIALTNLIHDGKDSRLVARYDDRFILADLVLQREELLGRLVDVGRVGESQLLRQWFHHGYASRRVAERADKRRINFDGSRAEQLADPVRDGCVQSASEKCTRRRILAGLLLLLRIELRLLLGSAECEEVEDVSLRQRWRGTIGRLQVCHIAVNADCDVIILHTSGNIEINGRIDANRITEVNGAAF